MTTQTLSIPAHIEAPADYVLPATLNEVERDGSEHAEASVLARVNYALAVSSLTIYNRTQAGETGDSIAQELTDPDTGKARNKNYVSRLALIGYAVSHGVTDVRAFRTAMRGMKVGDVRAVIGEHVNDDGIIEDDAELISAMTAEPKAEKAEKTPQESFDNRIKSASQTLAAAVSQFTADDADLIISDEVRAMLAVIASGVATLTA
jgi:hypothetical protein